MQLCCRTTLPGCTGLTIVIGGLPTRACVSACVYTHKRMPTCALTHSRPLGRINICWYCTLFQQCKIYSRCGGFTLCLRSNSSVQPNYLPQTDSINMGPAAALWPLSPSHSSLFRHCHYNRYYT